MTFLARIVSRGQKRDAGVPRAGFNLRVWFAVTAFVIIACMGTLFAVLMSQFVSDRMLQREAVVTQEFLESVVRAEKSGDELFAGGDSSTNGALGSFVGHIKNMPDVLRANVYALDRSIIWSTDEALIGQRFSGNPELEEAFHNKLVTEVGTLTADSKAEHVDLPADAQGVFIEAYIPMRTDGGILGVVELYKIPNALNETLREAQMIIWTSVLTGMAILFATLFWIVQRGARLINGQQVELGQMEALAAVGQMASAIAHNLRNPLAGIRSTAELVQLEQPSLAPEVRDIIGEVDRLDAYVRELLDYARAQTPSVQPIDPRDIVEETLARLAPALGRAGVVTSVVDGRAENSPVDADPQLLGQAMTSIVTNAIEAMPDGGRITARLEQSGPWLTVSFTDTGPGIPPEIRNRIAEPFFTTKTRGLGLGLALTRRMVERFGGKLDIGSGATGAIIGIRLPITARTR